MVLQVERKPSMLNELKTGALTLSDKTYAIIVVRDDAMPEHGSGNPQETLGDVLTYVELRRRVTYSEKPFEELLDDAEQAANILDRITDDALDEVRSTYVITVTAPDDATPSNAADGEGVMGAITEWADSWCHAGDDEAILEERMKAVVQDLVIERDQAKTMLAEILTIRNTLILATIAPGVDDGAASLLKSVADRLGEALTPTPSAAAGSDHEEG